MTRDQERWRSVVWWGLASFRWPNMLFRDRTNVISLVPRSVNERLHWPVENKISEVSICWFYQMVISGRKRSYDSSFKSDARVLWWANPNHNHRGQFREALMMKSVVDLSKSFWKRPELKRFSLTWARCIFLRSQLGRVKCGSICRKLSGHFLLGFEIVYAKTE